MANWQKLLRSLGFNDSEASLYLVSLENGPAAVQDLAKKANVSRVTAYAAIESLIKDGLMSTVQKGKKNLYVAEAPERLLSFVSTRLKSMETTLREIESSIDDLKLRQRGEKPVVKLFEGREALKAIQNDILVIKPKTIDEFGNYDAIRDAYNPQEELEPFYKEITKLKAQSRLVFLSKNQQLGPAQPNKRVRLLSPEKHQFGGDVLIYGNKVALSTFHGKQISVLIESRELAETMRALFDELWSDEKNSN